MQKVFISVPMRGRTKENIEKTIAKMQAITKVALGEDVEFLHTIVKDKPPYENQHQAVWYLGESLKILSQADVLVCVQRPYYIQAPGCEFEEEIFLEYNCGKVINLPVVTVFDQEELDALRNSYIEQKDKDEIL